MRRTRNLLEGVIRFAKTLLKPRRRLYRAYEPPPPGMAAQETKLLDALLPAARCATGEHQARLVDLLDAALREVAPLALMQAGLPGPAGRLRDAGSTREALTVVRFATELDDRVATPGVLSDPLEMERLWRAHRVMTQMREAARCEDHLRFTINNPGPLRIRRSTLFLWGGPCEVSYRTGEAADRIVCAAHAAGPEGRAALRLAIARASWCAEHEDCRVDRERALLCVLTRAEAGCAEHEDCRAVPEIGLACVAARILAMAKKALAKS